jgi:hypothetical protein
MFLKFHGLVVAVHKNAGNAQGGFSPTDAGLINGMPTARYFVLEGGLSRLTPAT